MLCHLKMRRHLQRILGWNSTDRSTSSWNEVLFVQPRTTRRASSVNVNDNCGPWLFLSVCVYDIPVSDNSFVFSLNEMYKYMIMDVAVEIHSAGSKRSIPVNHQFNSYLVKRSFREIKGVALPTWPPPLHLRFLLHGDLERLYFFHSFVHTLTDSLHLGPLGDWDRMSSQWTSLCSR